MLPEIIYTNEIEFQKLRNNTDKVIELIDDIIYMSPAPTGRYQDISFQISRLLDDILKESNCKMLQGINLRLFEKSSRNKIGDVIPDISVFCNSENEKLNGSFIEEIPLVIIEIVSPSSVYLDNIEKTHLYKRVGVQEYWIVDLKKKTAIIWDFKKDEQYIYDDSKIAKSTLFTEFSIDLAELFR